MKGPFFIIFQRVAFVLLLLNERLVDSRFEFLVGLISNSVKNLKTKI